MKKIIIILVIVIIIVLGYFIYFGINKSSIDETTTEKNTPNSAEGAPEGSIHNLPVPESVSTAKTALALRLNIDSSKILVLEAIKTDWSDSCLGLGGPAESCAAVITPGYNILMQANGKEYRYRTDETGTIIRAENI